MLRKFLVLVQIFFSSSLHITFYYFVRLVGWCFFETFVGVCCSSKCKDRRLFCRYVAYGMDISNVCRLSILPVIATYQRNESAKVKIKFDYRDGYL